MSQPNIPAVTIYIPSMTEHAYCVAPSPSHIACVREPAEQSVSACNELHQDSSKYAVFYFCFSRKRNVTRYKE